LRRLGLVSVVAGVVATSVAFWLIRVVVGLPLFPNLYPEGAIPTGFAWYIHVVLFTFPPLASLLLSFFLGGLAAGGVASATPGSNGAVSAALTGFGGFTWFVMPLLPLLWEPSGNHGEVYVLNEGLGTLIAASVTFCAVLPLVVLSGYLGARVGACVMGRVAGAGV
jgi:hypothetical protein